MDACNKPSSHPLLTSFFGSSRFSSASRAAVRRSLTAYLFTASISICCSSVGSNEYMLLLLGEDLRIWYFSQAAIMSGPLLFQLTWVDDLDHAVFVKVLNIRPCLFDHQQLVVSAGLTIDGPADF